MAMDLSGDSSDRAGLGLPAYGDPFGDDDDVKREDGHSHGGKPCSNPDCQAQTSKRIKPKQHEAAKRGAKQAGGKKTKRKAKRQQQPAASKEVQGKSLWNTKPKVGSKATPLSIVDKNLASLPSIAIEGVNETIWATRAVRTRLVVRLLGATTQPMTGGTPSVTEARAVNELLKKVSDVSVLGSIAYVHFLESTSDSLLQCMAEEGNKCAIGARAQEIGIMASTTCRVMMPQQFSAILLEGVPQWARDKRTLNDALRDLGFDPLFWRRDSQRQTLMAFTDAPDQAKALADLGELVFSAK
jgi:hypothetical protein